MKNESYVNYQELFEQWLKASYKYYILYTDTGWEDYHYDYVSKILLDNWDSWNHEYKWIVEKEDLACGSGYKIAKEIYPEWAKK